MYVGCRSWMDGQAYHPENPELTLNEIYTLQQEVDALQEQFDQLEDEELKWALEQDIVGKVRFTWIIMFHELILCVKKMLWICCCRIQSDVDQVLSKVCG